MIKLPWVFRSNMKDQQQKKWASLGRIIRTSIWMVLLTFGIVLAMASAAPANQVNFAIKPQFDVAEDFAEGLARVGLIKKPDVPSDFPDIYGYKDVDRYGYIDKSGKLVIPFQYKNARNFSEGLAAVEGEKDGNSKAFGYIDKTGKIAIAPQFLTAGKFSGGLAPVTTETARGYINKAGKMVLKLKYTVMSEFQENLALVGTESKDPQNSRDKYGYINRQGKLVIPLRFTQANNFSQGLAAVATPKSRGYIDKRGKFIFKNPAMDSYISGDFQEGMASLELSKGACSAANYCEFVYIDRRGKVAIKPTTNRLFTRAGNFAGGLAPVATGGGGRDAGGFFPATDWGFINKRGKFVIAPQFDDAGSFSEGLARVSVKGQYGYITPP
jgi:WG containing repeat